MEVNETSARTDIHSEALLEDNLMEDDKSITNTTTRNSTGNELSIFKNARMGNEKVISTSTKEIKLDFEKKFKNVFIITTIVAP